MNFYILAGGRSRRLGRNKALLKLQNQTLIERVLGAVPDGYTAKVVARSTEVYRFLGCSVISDIHRNCGPLGGVHTGLVDAKSQRSFFLACDLPFITADLILQLLEQHAGQPIFGIEDEMGRRPLCTIYCEPCLSVIENQIRMKDFSLQKLATLLPSTFIKLGGPANFVNVNTEQDWRSAQALAWKSQ